MGLNESYERPADGRDMPWRNAWLSLVAERRTTAGRLGVLGAHAGLIGGAWLPFVLLAENELAGRGSSTSVLAIFVLPIYVPLFAFAGAACVGVFVWWVARLSGVGKPPAESLATVQAFRASRWVGVALAAMVTLATVMSGR